MFDLIGVLAEPSWREVVCTPDLTKWRKFRVGKCSESKFWSDEEASTYRALLGFRPSRLAYWQQLKKRGVRVCVATNFRASWWEVLEHKLPTPSLVDKVVISEKLRIAKPDPRFFEALRDIVPTGSIMVDDSAENCEAAARAGLRPIWTYPGIHLEAAVDALLKETHPHKPRQRTGATTTAAKQLRRSALHPQHEESEWPSIPCAQSRSDER